MLSFWGNLGQNYAWELSLFHKYRSFSDGVTVLEAQADVSWYEGDHNPQGTIALRVLNYTILEFQIYNTNHVEEDE